VLADDDRVDADLLPPVVVAMGGTLESVKKSTGGQSATSPPRAPGSPREAERIWASTEAGWFLWDLMSDGSFRSTFMK
jgi:hypothetical protein